MSLVATPPASFPRATYRLQFHKGFPFAAASDLGPYLHELGISHVYSSPILTARAGSLHGYDVVDHSRVNPELGGEEEFRKLALRLRQLAIGLILDIVPNHMAVGAENKLWMDVLKRGRESQYADWFDIDFDCNDPSLRGKVHAPFLGAPYAATLAAGGIRIIERGDGDGYAASVDGNLFPIRVEDEAQIRRDGPKSFEDPARLDGLLRRQNFALDWWRNAGDRINWRRFFDVTELAAIRMDNPDAFESAHAVAFRLFDEGLIDGLRADHIDGLADPAGYCAKVRARLDATRPAARDSGRSRPWFVVEKILMEGEGLPREWGTDGTTGYDFMEQVSALLHAPDCAPELAAHWSARSGRAGTFVHEERLARRQVLENAFGGQLEELALRMHRLASRRPDGDTVPVAAFRRALTDFLGYFHAYRTYANPAGSASSEAFDSALEFARRDPYANGPVLDALHGIFEGSDAFGSKDELGACIRLFNQLSAPLAAKAIEDTAFYRYGRLLSRNDVGSNAARMSLDIADFHELMKVRAREWPHAMLTTATHDHKRGEDVRARRAVISELPDAWIRASEEWREINKPFRPDMLDPADEYMLYQTLAGAWPLDLAVEQAAGWETFGERIKAWWIKALREAKLRTSWAQPNEAYEDGARIFLERILDGALSKRFLKSIFSFVQEIGIRGAVNSLSQTTLKYTLPGVPDLYQGAEFWDFSLVDPDNRRPVDFTERSRNLESSEPMETLVPRWRDGRVKQALIQALLNLRRRHPDLFETGDYEPISVHGLRAGNVVAFARRVAGKALYIVVAVRVADCLRTSNSLSPAGGWWKDTFLELDRDRGGEVIPVIGGTASAPGRPALSNLLASLPLAVWMVQG
jgi:(1->4)-alpha-D-glucan 1-alpha-D-glucosylmutase